MKTFEQLTHAQRKEAILRIKQETVDHLIEGILDFEDVKLQTKIENAIANSTDLEIARKKIESILGDKLIGMVMAVAETTIYTNEGNCIVPELEDMEGEGLFI